MRSFSRFVLLSLVFSLLCLTGMAFAQEPDQIIGMTLETNELSLNIGESYRFLPDFQTVGEAGFTNAILHIYSSDENVIAVATDPDDYNTITAVGGGSAKLFLFSAGYEASAVCSVTVAGPANETVGKDGGWNAPTAAEMKKIQDPGLKAFFETLAKPEMANAAPALAAKTEFNALVTVSSGKAGDMAALAEELGMSPVYAFKVIDAIGVTGTADQFLALLKNKNVLFVVENQRYSVNDTSGRHMFEGQAETLSHVSAAGEAGLTGAGTVVAILDTGVDESHEQFTGKPGGSIIAQACFSYEDDYSTPACANGTTEDLSTSAIGSQISHPENFEHGTHVAAIAAGKDGVAPGASIIAVNIFYEDYYYNNQNQKVYGSHFYAQELYRAMDYLIDFNLNDSGGFYWGGQYYNFASINMSLGGGKYTAACTKTTTGRYEAYTEAYFAWFLQYNIIPVVSSGNESYDKAISWPACAPSAFAVGALHDGPVPEVAVYSNHSAMVDIMAPGTQIYSAVPNWNHSANSYAAWNGTSMAAPFVSGSFALMRQAFPNMNAADLQTLITGTTSQTAVRAGVKKPALDLSGIASIYDGPALTIFGGDKSLELNFAATPYKTNFEIKIYKAKSSNVTQIDSLVKTQKASSPKKVSLKSLVNNQPYILDITGEAVFGKIKVPIQGIRVYGMPMTQGKGYALSCADDAGTSVKFTWTTESGFSLYATYGPGPDDQPYVLPNAHNQTALAAADQPFYATLYKSVYKPLTNDLGVTYWSLPTALEIVPLSKPKLIGWHEVNHVDTYDVSPAFGGNAKAWMRFEAKKNITAREVWVYTLIDLDHYSSLKKLTVNTTKSPEDVLVTGLKNDTLYNICVRDQAKVGKNTYTGGWTCVYNYPHADTWDPNDYDGATERWMYWGRFNNISVRTGSQNAVLSFNKDLAVDGFRFELKPLAPNGTHTVFDVNANQAQGTYNFTKLTDGTVYKLRFRSYIKNGKLISTSAWYPDLNNSKGDASWRGLVFVPLPEPEAELNPMTSSSSTLQLKVRNNSAADGFTILTTGGSASYTPIYTSMPWSTAGEYTSYESAVSGNSNTMVVMLYKDFDGARYYGPAMTFGDITDSNYNYSYGPKSADVFDLSIFPEMRYAPQVNGQINFAGLTEAKSADEVSETADPATAPLPEDLTAALDKNGTDTMANVQISYFDSDSNSDTVEINVEEESVESAPKSLSEPVPVPQDNSPFTLYVIGN